MPNSRPRAIQWLGSHVGRLRRARNVPETSAFAIHAETGGEWMDSYLEAREAKDSEAVVALFSEEAVCQSIPGVESETFVGRDAIG